MITQVLTAVAVLCIVGFAAAVILVIAAKFMSVPVDETAEKLTAALPGANCGACGYAGCSNYAEAVSKGEAKIGLCIPGGDKAALDMSNIMGVEAVDIEERTAVVRCRGSFSVTTDKYEYQGVSGCRAAAMMYKGSSACPFGCLGYGDCVAACKFDAIKVVNGVAVVNYEACKGCGACASACPKGIIEVVPLGKKSIVSCMNEDKGGVTRKYCTAGCIGCMRCQKACELGAVTVTNNLAKVDFTKCTGCGKCQDVCPTKAIHMLMLEQTSLIG